MAAGTIGQPLSRVDGKLKVTGHALYTADHPVPNVAHGVLVMSTIAKGRIRSIDANAAEQAPGVLSVVTHLNAPRLPEKPKASDPGRSSDRKLQLLQSDRVLYSHQPVAIVVAETLERAWHASELLKVNYEVEPHEVNFDRALKAAYAPEKAGGGGEPAASLRGDVDTGRAQAARSIEQTYVTPIETHNPMEPHATVAMWQAERLMLFDASQGVFGDRERVATVLGMPPEQIHVVSLFLGGGFGSKGPTWSHVVLAAMAARVVRRPVKLVLAREQMFGPVGFRSKTKQTVMIAAKADASLISLRHDTVAQTSSFDEYVEAASLTARMLYACENASTSHKLVRLDMGTPSYMRAPGEAPGTYGLEAALDELARELNVDPLELRLRNYAEEDPDKKRPWSSKSLKECYRQGAERFGWSKRRPEPRSMRDGHFLVGWGMATSVYPTRRSPASAKATLRPDGSFLVEAGTQDLGTGTYTIMTQVAADALGVKPGQVQFHLGDTSFPETPVSGGSQTAASTGSAVRAAGEALRERLLQIATTSPQSPLNGVPAQDIVLERRALRSHSNPGKQWPLSELARQYGLPITAEANAKPGEEKNQYSMYAFGAQFAEVRVDADLGQVKVMRMVGAFGAGTILNQKTARSQLMGGMIWGIGMALVENTMVDQQRGRVVNANLAEYHVPVNLDAPEIEIITVEEHDSHVNPLGAKGIGEIGITGATAAIANAVYHATGRRIRELPITPDKLL